MSKQLLFYFDSG